MNLLVLLFVGTSVLIIALSVPMILGRVPPNRWYGLRTTLTLNNPGIWVPANRRAGWLLLAYGLVILVASLVLGFGLSLGGFEEQIAMDIYGLTMAVLLLLGIVPLVVLSLRFARQLERDHEAGE